MRLGRIGMVAAAAIAWSTGAGLGAERMDPAELAEIGPYSSGRRLIVRFDFSRVEQAEDIAKATLHLEGEALAGPVEVCPVLSEWGSAGQALHRRQLQGVWRKEDLTEPNYRVAADLFLIGQVDWEWACRGVARWKTPGGDLGAAVARIEPGLATAEPGGAVSVDLTALVKRWIARPVENYGIVLKPADEGRDSNLKGRFCRLEIDGPGVKADRRLRLIDPPDWLPRGWKVDHPRLPYPTAQWLAELKADPQRLAELTRQADSFDLEEGRSLLMPALVLAARVDPTPARIDLLNRAVEAKFPNHGGHEVAYALAVLYDWGYDLLGEPARRALLWRLERTCWSQETGSAETIISPFNDVGTSRFGCGLLWAAIAIYPDLPSASQHLFRAKAYYIDTSIPVWHAILGDDGGYWHEMHSYYLQTCIGTALARVLSVWSTASGSDQYRQNPWLEGMVYFPIYSTRPDLYRIRIGDVKCSEAAYGEAPVVLPSSAALVQHFDNPYGRAWLKRFGGVKLDGVTPTEYPWGPPLAKDAPVKSWEQLPLVRHSDGLGVVNMRSDWSEDATYVWFKCGPSFWSHSHYDSGTFAVYKRGALAIDAGNYSYGYNTEHYRKYARLSIAHNVITVTNPDEAAWKDLPNDGGQRFTAGEHGTSAPYSLAEWKDRFEEFDTGHIVAFQTHPSFTYVCGDTTNAYNNAQSGSRPGPARSRRVSKLLRALLYLPPDHLVVFDQVAGVKPEYAKRWLLHTINEPKVSGDGPDTLITVERADTCFKFQGWDKTLKYAITTPADHAFFKAHPDVKWYGGYQPQLYQYDGVMFVRPLLPGGDRRIEVIGGPGKECWVDGKNYDLVAGSEFDRASQKRVSFRPYTGEGETGRYRVEISPGAPPAERTLFLNVIQVAAKSQSPVPTPARLLGSQYELEVVLTDGRKATIRFKEGVGGHVAIEKAGRVLADVALAEKVLPNPRIEK